MRNRYSVLVVAFSCLLVVAFFASVVRSQEKPADSPAAAPAAARDSSTAAEKAGQQAGQQGGPSMEEMMKAWEKYGTPGKEHEIFKALEGKFDADVTMSMPGAPAPEKSTGKAENKPIFGGRYLHQDWSGSFMGKPFKGAGLWAFDKIKEKYVNLWIDDMSTMVMISEGTADSSAGGKVITTTGKCPDPMQGNKEKTIKGVLTVTDDDNHTYEMYESMDGTPEHKCLTIKYTRAK